MSLKTETAEAICSALYQMPFVEFLGEAEQRGGIWQAWFHVGERPKDMRVTVQRTEDAEQVTLMLEWRNYQADGRNPLRGEQTLTISTIGGRAEIEPATQAAILRVLEVYQQIIAEDGVAGRIADLVPDTEEQTDDE
jgi:hypothetical protein